METGDERGELTIMHEIRAYRASLRELLQFSAHLDGCEEPMTDTCTCGLLQARWRARMALGVQK